MDHSLNQSTPKADLGSLFSGELSANPFPFFAQMRELGAIGRKALALTRRREETSCRIESSDFPLFGRESGVKVREEDA